MIRLLWQVWRCWRAHRTMRFGQLVVNVLGDARFGPDPFYVEDHDARGMFREFGASDL